MSDRVRGVVFALLLGGVGLAAPAVADDKLQLSKEEKELVELTNKERAKKKLPALKVDPLLMKAARAHAANMAKQGKMEHVLDGKAPPQRAEGVGYKLGWIGENIAAGEEWTLPGVMEDWMNSKLHRENILSKRFTEIGIGLATTAKGEVYYTQLFGKPKPR